MEKRRNHPSALLAENATALDVNTQKEIDQGWVVPIPTSIIQKTPDLNLTPLGGRHPKNNWRGWFTQTQTTYHPWLLLSICQWDISEPTTRQRPTGGVHLRLMPSTPPPSTPSTSNRTSYPTHLYQQIWFRRRLPVPPCFRKTRSKSHNNHQPHCIYPNTFTFRNNCRSKRLLLGEWGHHGPCQWYLTGTGLEPSGDTISPFNQTTWTWHIQKGSSLRHSQTTSSQTTTTLSLLRWLHWWFGNNGGTPFEPCPENITSTTTSYTFSLPTSGPTGTTTTSRRHITPQTFRRRPTIRNQNSTWLGHLHAVIPHLPTSRQGRGMVPRHKWHAQTSNSSHREISGKSHQRTKPCGVYYTSRSLLPQSHQTTIQPLRKIRTTIHCKIGNSRLKVLDTGPHNLFHRLELI